MIKIQPMVVVSSKWMQRSIPGSEIAVNGMSEIVAQLNFPSPLADSGEKRVRPTLQCRWTREFP